MIAAEARLSGFGGRQAGVEIATKTLYGRGVGIIRRADKIRFDGFPVPGTRPLVQALFVYQRYVFRLVKHGDFRKLNRRERSPDMIARTLRAGNQPTRRRHSLRYRDTTLGDRGAEQINQRG